MGVPTSEVGYTPAMPRREEHEAHKRTCGGIGGGSMIAKERNIRGRYAVLLSTACKVLINYKLHVNRPTPLPTLHSLRSDATANLSRLVLQFTFLDCPL
jgi:hypothetical protein